MFVQNSGPGSRVSPSCNRVGQCELVSGSPRVHCIDIPGQIYVCQGSQPLLDSLSILAQRAHEA